MFARGTGIDRAHRRLRWRIAALVAVEGAVLLSACSIPPKLNIAQPAIAIANRSCVANVASSDLSETCSAETISHQSGAAYDATDDALREIRVALHQPTAALDGEAHAQRATRPSFNLADTSREAAAGAQRQAALADAKATKAAVAAAEKARQTDVELQAQIDELHAITTDRGLVMTLGYSSFASSTARLNDGANDRLDKLAAFLNRNPDRKTRIEGYTDSTGAEDFNQGLSERRAESVKVFLIAHGVAPTCLAASGKGQSLPIGDNSSATGRRQNRRVEIIIENNLASNCAWKSEA